MISPVSTACIPSLPERAIAAARSVTVEKGGNQHSLTASDVTAKKAAKIHGVSRTTVICAQAVIECVSDEPLRRLESGDLNVQEAYELAKKLGRRKVCRQRPATVPVSDTWQILVL